jgi:hypothetical protein
MGEWGIAAPFLTTALDGGEWSASNNLTAEDTRNIVSQILLRAKVVHGKSSLNSCGKKSLSWHRNLVSERNMITFLFWYNLVEVPDFLDLFSEMFDLSFPSQTHY